VRHQAELAPPAELEALDEEVAAARAIDTILPPGSRARSVLGLGVVAWSFVGIAVIAFFLVRLLDRLGPVFPPLVAAALTVFVLEPAVGWFERRGLGRRLAVIVVFVLAGAVLAAFTAFAVPAVVRQFDAFITSSPALAGKGGFLGNLTDSNSEILRSIGTGIQGWLARNAASPAAAARLAEVGLKLAQAGLVVLVGLILAFFVLVSREALVRGASALLPATRRRALQPTIDEIRRLLSGYVRARLIVSAVVGVLATIAFWAIGMPFWLLLGIIVGITNLIPMLGTFIGAVPVALVAILTKPPAFLIVVVVMVALVHSVDGYFLSPLVLKETVDIHPAIALLSVIIGAEVLGFWGILAAIPVAGLVQMALRHWAARWRARVQAGSAPAAPV